MTKISTLCLILASSFFLLYCGSGPLESGPGEIPMATLLITGGDSVVANTAAIVYDDNRVNIGTAPQGSVGLVTDTEGNRSKVDFTSPDLHGWVKDSELDTIGDPGCEPDCPEPGDYQLIMVGFSNTRQIIQGAPQGYDIGDDDPRMRGKAMPAYGDPGAASYAEGLAIVRTQLANNPEADGIAVMLGHRYNAMNPGGIIEGARSFDVVDTLDAPYSGSPRYSEMEMVRNVAAMLDAEAPGLDHYLIGLHRYVPEDNCERKIGEFVPLALEMMIDAAVAQGVISSLSIAGDPFRLGPVESASGHIDTDDCHLSEPAGVDWVWEKDGGLKELIDGL